MFSRLVLDARYLRGLEVARQHDLQHFDVFAVSDLAVANLGGLIDARSGFEAHPALTLVLELDPALQDVNELKDRLVLVRLAREFSPGGGPDDMGSDTSVGSRLDPEIPVLEE